MKATQQWRLSSVGGLLGIPAAAIGDAMSVRSKRATANLRRAARLQIFEHLLLLSFAAAIKCDETNK